MVAEQRTIAQFGRALRQRELTAEAATDACLRQIAERDPAINAYITVLSERARADAHAADRELAAGRDRGPLHGVPISLKDIIDVAGVPTTAASRLRQGHVAVADAEVVQRLREAGAVIIGKTNLHEFALGTTNEDSAYGPVKHPLDPTRSPGGSSGGSAASVLAGMAWASIGTDTGGSIRIPAAACGLVGLKPAIGEVSLDGVVPLSATLDHVGPLCRSVEDAAIIHAVLAGDRPGPPPTRPVAGVRLARLRGYFTELLDAGIAAAFEQACARLEGTGVTLREARIAHTAEIPAIYTHIALPETVTYHAATLESRADEYTAPVRLRLEMGRYILGEDYVRAQQGRRVLQHEVNHALTEVDALLLPTLPVPATKLGEENVRVGNGDQPVRAMTLRLTQLFNITGHPAITVPCGITGDGLPVGAQLVGRSTAELLRVAAALEPYLGPGRSR